MYRISKWITYIFIASCLIGCGDPQAQEKEEGAQDTPIPYVPKQNQPPKKDITFTLVQGEGAITIDANLVKAFYDKIAQTAEFQQELEVDTLSVINYKFDKKLVGDINRDGVEDMLLLITKNINDKRSFQRYYVVAFNNGVELIPIEYYFAGGHESEYLTEFTTITDSATVKGVLKPNHFIKSPDVYPIEYSFDGRELISL